MKILNFIKDLLAPKKCYSCSKEGHFLCNKCLGKVKKFKSICYVCKKESKNFKIHNNCSKEAFFDKLIIFAHYRDKIIKKLIKDFKFYGKKDIIEDLGTYMGELLLKNIKNFEGNIIYDDFVITSVPMYFTKKIMRGYNQSEILGNSISKNTGICFDKNIVKKIKNTRQQSKLSRQERLENTKNIYKINQKKLIKYKNKYIILVDDVVSTGSTINEISKELKIAGVKNVIGICIASD